VDEKNRGGHFIRLNKGDIISTEIGEFPGHWRVQRFDSLFTVQQGKQVSKMNRIGENQRPFLRTKNVSWGGLDLSELDEMHFSEAEENRLALFPGDLLVCEGGDIGRTAIWAGVLPRCYYQNHLHRARLRDEPATDSQFTLYWLWYAFDIGSVYFGRGNATTIPNLSQSKLCELLLPVPPLTEQRRIAGVLSVVQRAIEQQERLIARTKELKKALLHQLFTHGLHGESQKQTEIGPVPESWDVVPLGSLVVDAPQVNMRSEAERIIQYIDVSSISRDHLRIRSTESFVLKEAPGRARKKVRAGDVIFATVRPTLLRLVRIAGEYDGQVCSTAFCVLRDKNERTSGRFIYYLLQREQFLKQLAAIESGASYPAVKDGQVKGQLVPVPQEAEQVDIAANLEACDAKIDLHRRKHTALTNFFRTLLHQLMTAQIRLHDIDLDGILSQAVIDNGDKVSPNFQQPDRKRKSTS
jgi:type I restriction enzyme S subunit